ncbi:Fc.00g042420.m01.CDS01 [Cosmosporella sp. VM-42]
MSSKLIPSNPSDVMVIRNVTPNIATFSVPFSRFGKIKVGGRGTLVKLSSGNLAVFSPVALTDAVRAKVDEMGGSVSYIVALDFEHHIFISEWARAYPGAKIVGVEGLPEKRAKQSHEDEKIGDEKFDVVFTKANKKTTHISEEFDADFQYEYVDGHANLELVFLYKPEKVVIEADLLFNLPATEQYSKVPEAERPSGGFVGKIFEGVQNIEGEAKWLKRFNWYTAKDRTSFNESMKVINEWDFVTMIPCHGDVMEGDGKEKFLKVFEWHLKGKH